MERFLIERGERVLRVRSTLMSSPRRRRAGAASPDRASARPGQQTMRVRIAHHELRSIRELTQTIKALEAEIAHLVAQIAPHLLFRARVA